jgi:membrane associated rhomboid family serine protease
LYLWYSSWAANRNIDNIGHDAHFYGAIAGFILTFLLFRHEFSIFINKLLGVFN